MQLSFVQSWHCPGHSAPGLAPWRHWQTETARFLLPERTSPPGLALAMSSSSHPGLLTGPSTKILPTPRVSLCAWLRLLLELTSASTHPLLSHPHHRAAVEVPTQPQHRAVPSAGASPAAPWPQECPALAPPHPHHPGGAQPQDPLHSSLKQTILQGRPGPRAPSPMPPPWGLSSPGMPILSV